MPFEVVALNLENRIADGASVAGIEWAELTRNAVDLRPCQRIVVFHTSRRGSA